MVMDFVGPSVTEGGGALDKLEITAAFTKVLTAGYIPDHAQASYISSDYLVLLNGISNFIADSYVTLLNSSGVTQNTLQYYANTTGEWIRIRAVSCNANAMFFIGDDTANDIYIWSTDLDGTTVNWGRRLGYSGTTQGAACIAVTSDYVYFFCEYGTPSFGVLGQISASTGALNWDKSTGVAWAGVGGALWADNNQVYLSSITNTLGVLAVDTTGAKVWQKTVSAAVTNLRGMVIGDTHVFVWGNDSSSGLQHTVLKLDKIDGSLTAQVKINTSAPVVSFRDRNPTMGYGGGKVVFGYYEGDGSTRGVECVVMDTDLNVETTFFKLQKSGSMDVYGPYSIVVDDGGNWFVTGNREDSTSRDNFISGVLENGTTSTGWTTASLSVATPAYSVGNGSTTLSDITPSTNASETITVSSPADLTTESW